MLARLVELLRCEDAVTSMEYALLLALVSVAAIAVWHSLGVAVAARASNINAGFK